MIQITIRVEFCAGHRLIGHEGRCRQVHGHNYTALLTAEPEEAAVPAGGEAAALDAVGRVVDFAVLRDRVGGWIDTHWDHRFILSGEDRSMIAFLREDGQPYYTLPINPTAEAMAHHLLHVAGPEALAGTGVRLVRVELYETADCGAVASL